MYRFRDVVITQFQIVERLKQERRRTSACPFCSGRKIEPEVLGCGFFMTCRGCGAQGPTKYDYADPAGLCETSWIVALKKCHDAWNGRERAKDQTAIIHVKES